jgi:hypothetical protein
MGNLLPCPFCADVNPHVADMQSAMAVVCSNSTCGAEGPWVDFDSDTASYHETLLAESAAEAAWNQRREPLSRRT